MIKYKLQKQQLNIQYWILQNWVIKWDDKNNNGKIQNVFISTKTNNPKGFSRAESLPAVGNSFIDIETSSNHHGNNVFVSFERTYIIQISNTTFYYNRFSILTNDSLKSLGRFRIQILLEDKTWSARYNIPKNDRYSDSSTNWTKLSLNFTVENYGVKLIYDEIDTAHADMSFSNITIAHSVYQMDDVIYSKDLFESIPDYREIVLSMFLIKDDKNLLKEVGFSKKR